MKAVSACLNSGFGKGFAKPLGSGGRPVIDDMGDGVGIDMDVGTMLMTAEVASNVLE
tara:strand:- start:6125 stop:6295 length:171 start_codon:yes stop_codon:yes gene_type:complete